MSRLAPLALVLALLGGCAGDYYGYGGGVALGYDGFYDGYYGPFYDGYWARDGYFRYRDARGRFHRDTGRHFRREGAPGFNPVHGRPRAGGGYPRR